MELAYTGYCLGRVKIFMHPRKVAVLFGSDTYESFHTGKLIIGITVLMLSVDTSCVHQCRVVPVRCVCADAGCLNFLDPSPKRPGN